jgi:hypothetical protein
MDFIINEPIKTGLGALYNSEHFDVCQKNIVEPLTVPIQTVPSLVPAFLIVQGNFVRIDNLFKNSRTASQTKEIEHLYHYSRALFGLYKHAVYAASISTEAAEVAAAKILEPLLKIYKEVPGATYAQQSGLLANFAVDCGKPTYLPSATSLGLNPLAARLLTVNNTFGSLIEERGLEKEVAMGEGTLAEAREAMDSSIVVMIALVNNNYTLNELGAKDPVLRGNLLQIAMIINFAIHRIKQIIASRGHSSGGSSGGGGTTDEGTQAPDITNPPAPETPPQQPDITIPPINPEDLNPPAAGE